MKDKEIETWEDAKGRFNIGGFVRIPKRKKHRNENGIDWGTIVEINQENGQIMVRVGKHNCVFPHHRLENISKVMKEKFTTHPPNLLQL